ncbi:hypothetical protein [Bradyrhizobium sp. OAE829]|uniref:hypothetical protein n=1 Tax=Bradyrhizobium sp. OAE829 TaxID=2663807 RepID=UPI001789A482
MENSLFLMVNGHPDSARLLKHLAAKGKPEKRRRTARTGKETGKKPACHLYE